MLIRYLLCPFCEEKRLYPYTENKINKFLCPRCKRRFYQNRKSPDDNIIYCNLIKEDDSGKPKRIVISKYEPYKKRMPDIPKIDKDNIYPRTKKSKNNTQKNKEMKPTKMCISCNKKTVWGRTDYCYSCYKNILHR